jgi:hypothetical protein
VSSWEFSLLFSRPNQFQPRPKWPGRVWHSPKKKRNGKYLWVDLSPTPVLGRC